MGKFGVLGAAQDRPLSKESYTMANARPSPWLTALRNGNQILARPDALEVRRAYANCNCSSAVLPKPKR